MTDRQTNVASYVVDGQRYDIDTYDIDGLEWRDAKRASGLTQSEIWRGALVDGDLECIGVLLWIWRRRDESGLKLEDVLRSISFGAVEVADKEAASDPPD